MDRRSETQSSSNTHRWWIIGLIMLTTTLASGIALSWKEIYGESWIQGDFFPFQGNYSTAGLQSPVFSNGTATMTLNHTDAGSNILPFVRFEVPNTKAGGSTAGFLSSVFSNVTALANSTLTDAIDTGRTVVSFAMTGKSKADQGDDRASPTSAVPLAKQFVSREHRTPSNTNFVIKGSTADPQILKTISVRDGRYRRVFFDPWRYPLAVCNDGSPATYLYSPPFERPKEPVPEEEGHQTFVVMLAGGGWCHDKTTCAARRMKSKKLTTSKLQPEVQPAFGGVLSTDKRNPFLNAHKVYLPYCSSDGFAGSQSASNPLAHGSHFRGADIIEAVMRELNRTLGIKSGDALFFGGFSAGARGAMFNIDYVPPVLPPNVSLTGLFDSPFWLEIEPFVLSESAKGVLSMANGRARRVTRTVDLIALHACTEKE
mmetsp:Transcript_2394/g.4825  ORF Transcript_2394/g.4825 Transcript_2394/m.4825 type:complete len:429 (-) Transcript_2394:416-1702(-)